MSRISDKFLTREQMTALLEARDILKARITYRELECARLLMLGYQALEIATALHMSVRTVEYYTKNLKSKCHCRSRWRLISHLRANLISFDL